MKESVIQKKIKDYLESIGAYVIKVQSASKAGVPDLVLCYKSLFIGIEVKTPETRTNISPLQLHNITLINKANGHAIVAWDVEGVKSLIRKIDETI
jgi:Holliday junction resolvase